MSDFNRIDPNTAEKLGVEKLTKARQGGSEETALAPTEDPSSHVPAMFAYAFIEALGGALPKEAAEPKMP